ncbi:phenazine biosynthesis FMN-dependent oxidase PhzG [Cellulomonas edaphi]|uniref:Pyridoxamine 5'-phosphate oxidase n=1 Tax=Cellulomonas edaphi TaxID=3053468 RepID=A0ABT7SA78_9CELL|nr:phenazine biosynthesis FMN-dependent oxidase PhzG [Cellulomons edaphi]MDM7832531.1 phenazine biosynthesis FMN-dependent oxidase PhzG [Cellulomons edaphi]
MSTLSGDANLSLPEFDAPPPDPLALLRAWIAAAEQRDVREPCAVTLATADSSGAPATRSVMVKAVDERGLVFGSYRTSRKGEHLAANPRAALTFYWRELLQQVNVAGVVETLADDASDVLFSQRPPAAQATTAASRQSRPLASESALRAAAAALLDSGEPVVRPADWVGYRLVPDAIEFWYGSTERLHRRLQYTAAHGAWSAERLQP